MCPNCNHKWADQISGVMNHLKKVDFFWINRDQKSFEWFVSLLSQLELEMAETGGDGALSRFLEMHMYITSALQKTDMKSVFLQLAMDLNFKKEQRDFVTGLKSRTNAGNSKIHIFISLLFEYQRPAELEQGVHEDQRTKKRPGDCFLLWKPNVGQNIEGEM